MPADSSRRVVAGSVAEITPSNRKIIVPFRGRAGIGVFNVNGSYYALRNLCPHKQGPLCVGRVSGRVVAAAPPSTYAPELELVQDGEINPLPLAPLRVRNRHWTLPGRSAVAGQDLPRGRGR